MSSPSTFSGTLTGGIQDISALLPLVGTEQCEEHVGSALDRGFLYSAVTPVSIFGSLGIVRASFKILLASLNIRGFKFLGAKALMDSGFSPTGTVAPMVALDPNSPRRFLAETKLERMLAEQRINNVDSLTVSWGKHALQWNILLVASTLVVSLVGLVPYIAIIVDSDNINPRHFFPLGFGYPVLRVFGSAICVIVAQFLIQTRVLVLLKARLLFISMDQLLMEDKFGDHAPEIRAGLKHDGINAWAPNLAAEQNLWAFQKWLHRRSARDPELPPDRQAYDAISPHYASQYEQHFGRPGTRLIPPWITILLCIALAVGCISTVVGYIGCFFLIQHSNSAKGPLLWLVLEAVLSILRIFVWASNPLWDDSEGISFSLELVGHPPIITCNSSLKDILKREIPVPLTRSDVFRQQVHPYIGPIPTFSNQDVELYYLYVANRAIPSKDTSHPESIMRTLVIVISAHQGQSNYMLFTPTDQLEKALSEIYQCSIHRVPGTSVITAQIIKTIAVEQVFLPGTHTEASSLLAQVKDHYDAINAQLNSARSSNVFLNKPWAMQACTAGQEPHSSDVVHPRLKLSPLDKLTESDLAYLQLGLLQRRRFAACRLLEDWATVQVNKYHTRLVSAPKLILLSKDSATGNRKASAFLRRYDNLETEHLALACWEFFERLLAYMTCIYDLEVAKQHVKVLQAIRESFKNPTELKPTVRNAFTQQDNQIRAVDAEYAYTTEQEVALRHHSIQSRFVARRRTLQRLRRGSDRQGRDALEQAITVTIETGFRIISSNLAGLNPSSELWACLQLSDAERKEFMGKMKDRAEKSHLNDRVKFFDRNGFHLEKSCISQLVNRCVKRANQLFDMFEDFKGDLKDAINPPGGSPRSIHLAHDAFDINQVKSILRRVSKRWAQRARKGLNRPPLRRRRISSRKKIRKTS